MKHITDDDYMQMLNDRVELARARGKLEEARAHAMGQTAKVALLSASLAQADARNDTLVDAMKCAARALECWPKDPWITMRDVAADLRRAAT